MVMPWTLLDTAEVPVDGGELRLLRRGTEFSIRLGHAELMSSRFHGSEDALANLACARIGSLAHVRILIGGLGMGFTLRAALDALGEEARIVVAELVPAIIAWNRGPLAEASRHGLTDARVSIQEADVAALIRSERSSYDAILLDVDNGPRALTHGANKWLYDSAGLDAARSALRPGGVLAVWSAGPDAEFTQRLRKTGFDVDEVPVRTRGTRGARHVVWIAVRAHSRAQA